MDLQIFRDETAFDALQAVWDPLLRSSERDLIFLTHAWQKTWWRAYRRGDLYIIAGTHDGEVVGIAPWFVQHQPDRRILRTIGCVDVSDYLNLIMARGHETAFLTALAQHLATTDDTFDIVNLCNIPANSLTLKLWPPLLEQYGMSATIEQQEVCPVITLPHSWDEYLMQLDRKQRHELRRKIRRVGERADWYIVSPQHNLTEQIDLFCRLMAASDPEKALFLQDAANLAFFQAIIPEMMKQGWLHLSFLTLDGIPAATYLNFDYSNQILVYNSGQDAAQFGSQSPGIVLLARDIRYAIEQGRNTFDFLRGNETYKYHLGGQDTLLFKLKAVRKASQA